MENIERLIEDKELKTYVKERGLGTPATRASIIEELIAAGYIERSKKMLLLTGKVTLKNCTSSKSNKYSAVFALDDTGQYVNLRLVEFVNDKKRRTAD